MPLRNVSADICSVLMRNEGNLVSMLPPQSGETSWTWWTVSLRDIGFAVPSLSEKTALRGKAFRFYSNVSMIAAGDKLRAFSFKWQVNFYPWSLFPTMLDIFSLLSLRWLTRFSASCQYSQALRLSVSIATAYVQSYLYYCPRTYHGLSPALKISFLLLRSILFGIQHFSRFQYFFFHSGRLKPSLSQLDLPTDFYLREKQIVGGKTKFPIARDGT